MFTYNILKHIGPADVADVASWFLIMVLTLFSLALDIVLLPFELITLTVLALVHILD